MYSLVRVTTALSVLVATGCFAQLLAPSGGKSTPNAIQLENQKPGTSAWQIGLPPYVNSNDTDQWIRGYADAVSINKGAKITFNVTVNPYSWKATETPVPYTIDVYRLGWYGGLGGRLMKHLGPFPGRQQPGGTSAGGVTYPGCPYDAETGTIACQWTGDGIGNGSYTLDTSVAPDGSKTVDWTSGIYLALLTTKQVRFPTGCGAGGADPCDPDHQSYIIFAVREDGRPSSLLYQQPVATYQAYNNYPDDGQTGKSLYDSGSFGPLTNLGTQRAVKVSFDRPYTYTDHTGAGDFLHWELYFVRWMERNGYDVTYTTDIDTHADGTKLLQHKAIVVVGHPEYWSHEMRQAFETARDLGTSLSFFSANTAYTQVRFEPSAGSSPNRVITCYKDANLDPYNNGATASLTTVPFRNPPVNLPEQALLGTMYVDFFDAEAPAAAYVVQSSLNWVYAGTGLFDGSNIPGITGYEFDQYFSSFPAPAADPDTYRLLSNSPFAGANGQNFANASVYEAPSGAWVFNASTIDWSWGLDGYTPPVGINTRAVPAANISLQQITANILNKFQITRPVGPSSLAGTASSQGSSFSINLSWTDTSINETGFQVERSLDGSVFNILATAGKNKTAYADNAIIPGVGYSYRVTAVNAGGNSPYSNTVVAGTPPAAPSGLSGVAVSKSEIDLRWQDIATNETGYNILRSPTGTTGSYTLIGTVAPNTTSFLDPSLAAGTRYYYRVASFNNFGQSTFAATALLTLKK
jgi:fibronectin type 3 domain-containing protein